MFLGVDMDWTGQQIRLHNPKGFLDPPKPAVFFTDLGCIEIHLVGDRAEIPIEQCVILRFSRLSEGMVFLPASSSSPVSRFAISSNNLFLGSFLNAVSTVLSGSRAFFSFSSRFLLAMPTSAFSNPSAPGAGSLILSIPVFAHAFFREQLVFVGFVIVHDITRFVEQNWVVPLALLSPENLRYHIAVIVLKDEINIL